MIEADKLFYQFIKHEIQEALNGKTGIIQLVNEENKQNIFYMLCFCLCVPQAKAVLVDKAINKLKALDFYNIPIEQKQLASYLKGNVRFHNNKSKSLVNIRTIFDSLWYYLITNYQNYSRDKHNFELLKNIRNTLIKSIKGMSFKVASHFMRNIGFSGLAILDVHVINGLKSRNLIPISLELNTKNYYDVEAIMIEYAKMLGISLEELDLMFWCQKTGYVFK